MRTTKIIIALIIALVIFFGAVSGSAASKADDQLRDAAKLVSKARDAERSTERDENYQEAIKLYNKVEGDFSGTPQGAQALLQVAVINREIADGLTIPKEKSKYLYASYETLKRLVNIYDKPGEVLGSKLTRVEVREITETVARGKALKAQVTETLDGINSHSIQYKVLDFFVALTGRIPGFSYWFAVVLITVLVKLLITPLTKAQFKAMKEMQKVAPLIKQIQEKHKGDQKTIGEKTMEIYKEHRINPFASCLPLLVQMPILMLLYYTIRSYEFQFVKGTFLWIGSALSHLTSFPVMFNPGSLVWVTARNLAEPDLILVVLYVISMFISTKLSAVDPTQAEQQRMMAIVMPIMFAFIFAGFPSAFLLYWLVFNILQTAQQYMILRSGRDEVIVPVPATPPVQPQEGPSAENGGGESARINRRRRRRR